MIVRISFFMMLFVIPVPIYCQESDKNEAGISWAVNTNDAFSIEVSYHHMFGLNLGIGVGIGYYRQWYTDYVPNGQINQGKWTSWRISMTDERIDKLYASPSVAFRSPPLLNLGKYKARIKIEPGLIVQVPYTCVQIDYANSMNQDSSSRNFSTNKGNWCFWNLKSSLVIGFNPVSVSLGYAISNFDIYSSRRHLNVEDTFFSQFYPEKKLTHTLFINISHAF